MFEVILIFIIPTLFAAVRYIQITQLQPSKDYFSDGPYGDAAVYLLLIQFFRNFKDGDYDPRCLISKESINQPSLYEKIFGKLFSDRFLLAHSWCPNYLIFCCALLIFYSTLLLDGHSGLVLVFGMALFYFTPDHLIGDKWRIHFQSLQPRYLGAVCCSLFFLVCVAVDGSSDVRFLLLALIAFVAIQVSIFTRQCLVFVGGLFSLISADGLIAMAILAGFLLNFLFFGKKFIFDIKKELMYHHWYFNNYPSPSKSHRGFKKLITKYLVNSIVQFPLYLSFWVALGISVSSPLFHDKQTPEALVDYENFSALFVSVAAVACITSFRKFACFGESWRYIVFSCLFTLPLFWINVQYYSILQLISILVLISVLFTCLYINYNVRRQSDQTMFLENQTKSLQDVISKCSKNSFADVVWYGIPYSASTTLIIRGIGRAGFNFQIGNQGQELMRKYFIEYPILQWNKEILDGHGVTHILAEKSWLALFYSLSEANLESFKVVAENDEFIVFRYHSIFD